MPASPGIPFAMMAAVARPPVRGWKMSTMLDSTTGNSAKIPVRPGPSRALAPTTASTSAATSPARSGMSYQRRTTGGIGAA